MESRGNFYKSTNAILGKLGSPPPIDVVLKLVMSKCLPMLLYGVSASESQSKEMSKSTFAFNSIFFKLFGVKTKNEIAFIQHHCHILDYPRLQNYHRITFLNKLFYNNKIRSEKA